MKKVRFLSLIMLLLIVTGCGNNKSEQKVDIILNNNLNFEKNSELKLSSLVSKKNKVEIINKDEIIDTSSLGTKEIILKYKDKNKEKEYRFKIKIIDTQAPTIEYQKELSTTAGTSIDLLENVKVSDNSKEEIKANVEGNYTFDNAGEYTLKYVAVDSSNNRTEEEFKLTVNEKPVENNNYYNNIQENYEVIEDNTQCEQCFNNKLPANTLTDEYNWKYNNMVNHIRRDTCYWIVSNTTISQGEVVAVNGWFLTCANSGTVQAVALQHQDAFPQPPTGEEALRLYKENPNVKYGETTVYAVLE